MENNGPIRVALLSFAHNHQFHWARRFAKDERVEMVAAWDSDTNRGQKGAQELGIPFVENLDTVLSSQIDAVAICSETALHHKLALAAATAGKHILCEKPMALSLSQCQEMMSAAKRAGVTYMQAFPQRHLATNHAIKDVLTSAKLGKISLIRKRHGHFFALQGLAQGMPWIVDKNLAGAGGFFDEGIHECDVLRWFFGDPVAVSAMTGNAVAEIAEHRLDDFGAAIFRFAGGELAVLESGWSWVAGGPTTEIYGDQGTLIQTGTDVTSNRCSLGLPQLQVYTQASDTWEVIETHHDFSLAHESVAAAFVDCLANDEVPPVTGEDGMKALEMMLGAYLAARTGSTVKFPLTDIDEFVDLETID